MIPPTQRRWERSSWSHHGRAEMIVVRIVFLFTTTWFTPCSFMEGGLDRRRTLRTPRALESEASQTLRSIVNEPPSEGVTLLRFRFAPAFEWTTAQDATPPSGCSGVAGPPCPAMPLLHYVPSGLCEYCLYEYTHVLLSCCTLLRPIGM